MKTQPASTSDQRPAIIRSIQPLPDRITGFLPAEAHVLDQYPTFKEQITNLILANIDDEHYGIPELCRAAGISRSVLYRKLRAAGIPSVSRFIRSIRLQKAKVLLRQTDLSITQVAYEVGFKDAVYFSRVFSATFRMTPSKYRRR